MKVIYSNLEVGQWLSNENKGIVGFVPTMGALHKGHLSLIEQAKKKCNTVIVSIFVNPTQFNNKSDLKKYPKDLENDLAFLKRTAADLVYVPKTAKEVYENEIDMAFHFDKIDKVMEGRYREGHFIGVARVVKLFFDLLNPDIAFFGKKDYQQLLIIKELVNQFNLKTKIIGCETIREKDGLAMSSRNLRLSNSERLLAANIYKTLKFCKQKSSSVEFKELENKCFQELSKFSIPEYFEIRNANNLSKKGDDLCKWRAFAATKLGNVRLIDNIALN